jgi:hypothetical protein
MGTHANQKVNMILHAVNLEHFVSITLNGAGNEFVQFIFPGMNTARENGLRIRIDSVCE